MHKTSSGILVSSKVHWGILHTWQKGHWSLKIFPCSPKSLKAEIVWNYQQQKSGQKKRNDQYIKSVVDGRVNLARKKDVSLQTQPRNSENKTPPEREIITFLIAFLLIPVTHRSGRPLRINLMSRYICFSQNGRFDVSFEELFSKAKNPGGFFRKKRFLGSIFGFFSCSVAISEPICMKFWLPG